MGGNFKNFKVGGVVYMQELSREDIPVGEYEKLCHKSVYEYLTRNNEPDEQRYYRTDDGELWEISHFENEKSEEFGKRMDVLEYLSNKLDLAEAFGVL